MFSLWAIMAGIGAAIITFGGLMLKTYFAGRDKERLKNAEQQIQDEQAIDKRVTDGLDGDQRVRTDIANGGLRNDDGHKRVH